MSTTLTGEQLQTIAGWIEAGRNIAPATIDDAPPGFSGAWSPGDVLAAQGDAWAQVGSDGTIRSSAP